MSSFSGDLNFCPECGNVLPLPGLQDKVTCRRCSFSIPVREFCAQEITSTVVFNPVEQSSVALEDEEDAELKGPVATRTLPACCFCNATYHVCLTQYLERDILAFQIDRRCSRCNKEGMVYHTRQMRSADEGQTVFFTCIHCRYQEKEDS